MASNKIHLGNTKIVSDAEAPEGTIIATPTKSGTIALLSDVGGGASPVDTYTKTEIDAQQSKQNHDIAENHAATQTNSNRITKNEDDIQTNADAIAAIPAPIDSYTKDEVDAQQNLQDIEIAKNAEAISNIPAPINAYSKDQIDSQQQAQDDVTATKANKIDVYTKAEVDASQNEQDAEIVKKADKKDVIEDAPTDGETYARNNETWVSISDTSGIPDAPVDGSMYGRRNGEWDAVADAGNIYTKTEIDSQQSAQDTKIDKNKSDIAKNTADIAAIPAPIDSYTKAEVDASQEAQNTEINKKADKETTYTKAQIDSQQSAQDTKIDKNIDDIQTNADAIAAIPAPIDSYTKAEVDASQNEQDTEILKKADKADVYTKTEMDTQQSAQDTKIDKNVSDIAKNTADITKYTADVAKNTSDIAQNTADIAKNTADIEAMPPYVDAYTKTETNTLLDGKADKGTGGGGDYTPEKLVWEDKTAEREINTEYTNDSDVPRYVTYWHNSSSSVKSVAFYIDGVRIGVTGNPTGTQAISFTASHIVPAGSTYKTTGDESMTFSWKEARMPLALGSGGGDYTPETFVWEDRKLERDFGTYTNDWDVPRYVGIGITGLGDTDYAYTNFLIDGKYHASLGKQGLNTRDMSQGMFIVPAGSTYTLEKDGNAVIGNWWEARMPVAIGSGGSGGDYTPGPLVWQHVNSTKTVNTDYVNTNNTPLLVQFGLDITNPTGSANYAEFLIDGNVFGGNGKNTTTGTTYTSPSFTVPAGSTYQLRTTVTDGSVVVSQWREAKMPLAVPGDSIWTIKNNGFDDFAYFDGPIEFAPDTTTNYDKDDILFTSAGHLVRADRHTYVKDLTVNGVTVGRGNASKGSNLAVGTTPLNAITTGFGNLAVGNESQLSNTEGLYNTAIGHETLKWNLTGVKNTAVGSGSLQGATGANNTAIGTNSGKTLTTGSGNIVIGNEAQASSPTVDNEVTIGNDDVTATRLRGSVFVESNGNTDVRAIAPSGQYASLQVDNADVKYSMQIRPDQSNAFVIRNETSGQNSMSIATDGKVFFPIIVNSTGTYSNVSTGGAANVHIGADGTFYRSTATTYTTEEVDKRLAIKDKLIEKLSKRLDKLEARMKK